jgi:phycocyanobilin:ferredoxin oxidoreductase
MIKKLHEKYREIANQSFQRVKHPSQFINDEIIWENDLYFSPSLRYGHLEHFKSGNDRIEIIHCVVFPSYFKALPIFGFDVIALGGKITGLFCDFTQSPFKLEALSRSLKDLKHKYKDNIRQLPEWASFFSEDFIAIRPDGLNEDELIEDFVGLFRAFVGYANFYDTNGEYVKPDDVRLAINTHNSYSLNQRKNEKTSKALAAYIGEEKAKEFIEEVLFPVYRYNYF